MDNVVLDICSSSLKTVHSSSHDDFIFSFHWPISRHSHWFTLLFHLYNFLYVGFHKNSTDICQLPLKVTSYLQSCQFVSVFILLNFLFVPPAFGSFLLKFSLYWFSSYHSDPLFPEFCSSTNIVNGFSLAKKQFIVLFIRLLTLEVAWDKIHSHLTYPALIPHFTYISQGWGLHLPVGGESLPWWLTLLINIYQTLQARWNNQELFFLKI